MAILDHINIDFQLYSAGDPKILVIMDTSVWGAIENKPAIIEIVVPGSSKTKTYNFVKGKANVFNSSNLLLTSVESQGDLNDGIYSITVKGSPDSYCKTRHVLKTDKFELALDKMYISLGIYNKDKEANDKRNELLKIESLLRTSKAFIRDSKLSEGLDFFKKAYIKLNKFNDCNNC